ncbi:hypothetical protein Tco_1008328, partial [Tanacetum coccineum]
IIEYLVKISKKARILELKQRNMKISVLISNTPYPSRKIRCICACTLQMTTKEQDPIHRIQRRSIRRIQVMEIKYSRRYQTWSLLQETPNTPYGSLLIRRIDPIPDLINKKPKNRKLLKTLSLDESRSPEFNLFSDLEEYSEEEVAETMAETMEQYMSKTRADYGSGIARPKIDDKDSFELKGQFLKELRDNTFSGSDHEDANEHIEKVLEIVDLFHIPNITQDQVMLRAFPMSLTGAASRWLRNKPSGSITTWEDLKTKFLSKYCPPARTAKKMEEINNFQQEPDETLYQAWERFKELLMKCPQHYLTEMQEVILFYNGLDVQTRQILDSKGAIPSKTAADAKVAIQEMAEYSQKWHNGTSRTRSTETSNGLETIHAQLNNLGREIKKVNEKVSTAKIVHSMKKVKPSKKLTTLNLVDLSKERDIEQQLQDSTKGTMQTLRTKNEGNAAVQNQGALIKTLEIKIGKISKEKDPGSFTLPCYINNVCFDNALADLGASVSVMPLSTYLNLGLGELAHTKLTVELVNRTVKYPKGIVENVLVGIGKFVFPIDFIILDMPEDVEVPLILRRPFLSTAHAKIDVLRERMELDLEARLMGETLVLNRSLDPLYGDYFELNDLNVPLELRRDQVDDLMPTIDEGDIIDEPVIDIIKTRNNESFHEEFYNSIMRDEIKHKGKNVVGAFMNVPIFVKKISVATHFVEVENMDGYRDQDMGDIILGEPFCKASCVEARRFDGLITIHNGSDNVTYQMARSHLRFKNQSNAQYNKIKSLLKVSLHDMLNGISHPYQKLKSFYNGVLNLGPKYVRDAKMEEWLTREHIRVHEME